MALIVQKYGGSSVADAGKIKHVARRVAQTKDKGNQVVVVVSAMGDTTDELIKLAYQINDRPDGGAQGGAGERGSSRKHPRKHPGNKPPDRIQKDARSHK